MTVFRILPHQAALALPALRSLLPAAKATASVQALSTYLVVAGRSGYRLIGSFDTYEGMSSEALAVMGYRITHSMSHGRSLEISELHVLPEARGEGHRQKLLKWAETEALCQGCTSVQLGMDALAHNKDTSFFEQHGWDLAGFDYSKELRV